MSGPWTYELELPIPAAPERLFDALTRPEELREWFAEHATIDPRPGGDFRFWGRYTVGTPEEGESGGPVTAFEPGERLGFEWTLFGSPSTVALDLTPEDTDHGPATRVAVRHTIDPLFEGPRNEELVDDWWRFTLGNLMAWTTGRVRVVRVDFGDPRPEIRVSRRMDAPPETVFRALTEPEALDRWIGHGARVEPWEGGAWHLGWPTPEGYEGPGMRIRALVPDRTLAVSWPDWRGDNAVPDQTVTFELDAVEGGTRVTLTHSGFLRAVDVSDYPFGWEHFLSQMEEAAEAL